MGLTRWCMINWPPQRMHGPGVIRRGVGVMAVFRGTIHIIDPMQFLDPTYTFNIHVSNSGTSDAAWEDVHQIAEAFAGNLLPTTAQITTVSITNSDVVNGNQTRSISLAGARVVTGSPLPAWNVARIQMRANDGSRPSTFYPRIGLTENDVAGQVLEAAVQDALQSFLDDVGSQGSACTPAGQPFETFSFDTFVRMRQMTWHRRSLPGFKRGWVPV